MALVATLSGSCGTRHVALQMGRISVEAKTSHAAVRLGQMGQVNPHWTRGPEAHRKPPSRARQPIAQGYRAYMKVWIRYTRYQAPSIG